MAGRVHHPACAVSVAAFGETEAFECDDADAWVAAIAGVISGEASSGEGEASRTAAAASVATSDVHVECRRVFVVKRKPPPPSDAPQQGSCDVDHDVDAAESRLHAVKLTPSQVEVML